MGISGNLRIAPTILRIQFTHRFLFDFLTLAFGTVRACRAGFGFELPAAEALFSSSFTAFFAQQATKSSGRPFWRKLADWLQERLTSKSFPPASPTRNCLHLQVHIPQRPFPRFFSVNVDSCESPRWRCCHHSACDSSSMGHTVSHFAVTVSPHVARRSPVRWLAELLPAELLPNSGHSRWPHEMNRLLYEERNVDQCPPTGRESHRDS